MAAIKVHSLLGHQQRDLAVQCLSSLSRTSAEEITFVLHDDGTLTQDDVLFLHDHLPISSILLRREADERIEPLLGKYKSCRLYRRDHVMALKLFDVVLLGDPEVYYCDSDILFVAPHRGLFAGVLAKAQGVFMQDIQEAYSVQPWHIWPFSNLALRSRINAGLSAFRQEAFDLDCLEYYLGKMEGSVRFQTRTSWIEQTAWSVLAARTTCLAYDPRQIAMADPAFSYDPSQTIAIHFVSQFRYMIAGYQNMPLDRTSPAEIRLVKSPPISRINWFGEKAHRYVKYRASLLRKS